MGFVDQRLKMDMCYTSHAWVSLKRLELLVNDFGHIFLIRIQMEMIQEIVVQWIVVIMCQVKKMIHLFIFYSHPNTICRSRFDVLCFSYLSNLFSKVGMCICPCTEGFIQGLYYLNDYARM
jgi:hypothetical protein